MEKIFDVTLQGGKVTQVLTSDSIKDLSVQLSSYGQNVFWIFDSNSASLFSSLPDRRIVLQPGEKYKNWKSMEKIFSTALEYGLARDSIFIGFGGGVICDMAALAASLYMRGCRLVLVPTTLLCMVDASIGGKSAIDFAGGKNLIGSFFPAENVIISADTLRTLPESEYLCGLGEVIKHAFLTPDDKLYEFLVDNHEKIMKRERKTVSEMVKLSLEVKKSFIERDPEEKKGIRSFLNLGHTFAHALESSGRFSAFSHGKAVAWGCSRAAAAGVELGVTSPELRDRVDSLLRLYGYEIDYRIGRGDWLDFYDALLKDKKKSAGSVKFVLLQAQGEPVLMPLEAKLVQSLVISKPGKVTKELPVF